MTAPASTPPVTGLSRTLRMAAAVAIAVMLGPVAAIAQSSSKKSLSLIRDTEIEALVRDYALPIFRAAGISADRTRITLINDRSYNAFIADGKAIYINIGVLMDAQTPNEVIGVIAHESGHLAGGHLARLRQEVRNAQIISVIGMLAGGAAVVGGAGGRVGNSGVGAMGAIAGGQELAMRNLLAYARSEEQAADRAAVRYLDATGQSAKGILSTFRRFAEQGMFASRAVDPYLVSHPLPQERIAQLDQLARQSPHFDKTDPPSLQARHDLARAKLVGFTEGPDTVLRRYPPHNGSLAARYARAIAAYRSGRLPDALAQIEALIAAQPGNVYFRELRGQVLLESGRAALAVADLREAAQRAPGSALIRAMYGQALLETGPANLDAAIRELTVATQREPETAEPFQHLARAHANKGNLGMAELSAAQYAVLTGDYVTAKTQATRAATRLPKGSAAHAKAEDIANYEPLRN